MSPNFIKVLPFIILFAGCVQSEFDSVQGPKYTSSRSALREECIEIGIDCAGSSVGVIDKMLFGSFTEMHGGDLVPGVLEQYIVNTSFEVWNSNGSKGEEKNELVYTGDNVVVEDDNVAYPWEKRILSGTPTISVSTAQYRNTSRSQRVAVSNGSCAAIIQRLALPMYRVSSYRLEFYAKVTTTNIPQVNVSFHGEGTKEDIVLSDVFSLNIPTDGKWHKYVHVFDIEQSTNRFNSRHTKYNIWFEVSGSGQIFFDQVSLFPTDCVDGIFNPETVEYIRDYGITSIRWPGGNYTSGYNWKNGIGAWIDRPCTYNEAWGGLDSNFLGTDEIVRFCDITGIDLVMGVGYNPECISQQDIADWVEYCNGPTSTVYGTMRAANGSPDPYDIKYWGIGNEVYGEYQLGHTNVASYSSGLNSIASLVRQVDNDVVILASARGVHNQYRNAHLGWTESLYSTSRSSFDILDCHLYVYGFENPINYSGDEFFRVYAAAPLNLRDFLSTIRTSFPDKKVAFMEWGILPSLSGDDFTTPQRQTFANLLLTACEYHEMIRNCDIVSISAIHNFSVYIAPQRLHSEPVNMRTDVLKELSQLAGGYCLNVNESNIPTYQQNIDMLDVGIRNNVPEIDIIAVIKDKSLFISCVNKNTEDMYSISLDVNGAQLIGGEGRIYTCAQPYNRSRWTNPIYSTITQITLQGEDVIELPPLSYTFIEISLGKEDAMATIAPYTSNGDALDINM